MERCHWRVLAGRAAAALTAVSAGHALGLMGALALSVPLLPTTTAAAATNVGDALFLAEDTQTVSLVEDDPCNLEAVNLEEEEEGEADWRQACALSAVQVRGARLAAEARSDEGREGLGRRRRTDERLGPDLDEDWEHRLAAMAGMVTDTVVGIEATVKHLYTAVTAANGTLFKEVRGNMLRSPAATTFANASSPGGGGGVADEARSTPLRAAGGKPKHRKPLPPRRDRVLQLVTLQQYRLTRVWQSLRMLQLKMNWMATYLSAHRRLYKSCPVYEQDEAFNKVQVIPTKKIPREEDEEAAPELQDPFLDQIWFANNQTGDILKTLGGFDRMLEALRRRVGIQNSCKKDSQGCYEDAECCSGSCGFSAVCTPAR